jgi:hypothetical protein
MRAKLQTKPARLRDLIQRRDGVLAVLHPPTAAHARIMEAALWDSMTVLQSGGEKAWDAFV